MKPNSRVTIKDVAKMAGVTPQTVSRALRNAPEIADSTRKRVLAIAEQLNYVRNSAACAFRGGKTKIIAVFYDNFINLYFSIMMDYMQKLFSKKGYSLLPISTVESTLDEKGYKRAVEHNVDAIISFLEPEGCISNLITQYGLPVLVLGRRTDAWNIDCIYTDDEEGGRLVGECFCKQGCENILFITESMSISCAYDRHKGLADYLAANGKPQPRVIFHSERPLAEQMEIIKNSEKGLPDAVFCFNDMIAFELLHIIEKQGYPPMKIIGYDDLQNEIQISKLVTSIATNKEKLVNLVLKVITAKAEGTSIERVVKKIPVYLREGDTA